MPAPSHLFVQEGIDPLLADVPEAVTVRLAGPEHPARAELQGFIRTVFRQAHAAEVSAFYPNLLEFSVGGRVCAVVGYRDCEPAGVYAEQYLDQPAEQVAATLLDQPVARETMVEVGNLALAEPARARWVISAATAFLNAAGYRWVLFTATRPLANAFQRLGLRPMPLAEANPARLPDRGQSWGNYYCKAPWVYLGDIEAGCRKLASHNGRPPSVHRLLSMARHLGHDLARPRQVDGAGASL